MQRAAVVAPLAPPPAGYANGTLKLRARRVLEREVGPSVSPQTLPAALE